MADLLFFKTGGGRPARTADDWLRATAPAMLHAPPETLFCVGALIIDRAGRVFVQKRAPDRKLFPGCWDIAGGHVEPGESLHQALGREIQEETGWRLRAVKALVAVYDWAPDGPSDDQPRREADFLVEVDGDLDRPQIEADKFTNWRWVTRADLPVLRENRAPGDDFILDLVTRALDLAGR
jgi:hypothetical protein